MAPTGLARRSGAGLLGAGLLGAGLLGAGLLAGQAWLARRRSYLAGEDAPPACAEYGDGAPLRLVVAGDSTAAGVGATTTEATVGGRLAAAVAVETRRHVTLESVAVSGARTADLPEQARAAVGMDPTVVVVLVGANDATHPGSLSALQRDLARGVRLLREGGVEVVVGSCPDMGAARNFAQPLRTVVGWQGKRVARAEAAAAATAGGVVVPLGRLTGPAFRADPSNLASDLFHPSDHGYRLWADALLPAMLAAARVSG